MEIQMILGKIQKKKLFETLFADWQMKIKALSPTLKKKSINLLAEWAAESQIQNYENENRNR
jgi:hypothetical protein